MNYMTTDEQHLKVYDLFVNSENFLNELWKEEVEFIEGGWYGITFGYNFGHSLSSHRGSYGSLSGNYSGYGGYYNHSWC